MLSDLLTRLVRPLLSRPVTSGYPSVPIDLPANARGLPVLDASRCDGTEACVAACPTTAIALAGADPGRTWAVDAGRCIFCRACELACPRDAITMSGGVELAARERGALVSTTRLGRGGGL